MTSSGEVEVTEQTPLSSSVDFMDQFEGELNRRLAVLAVLYFRRRNCPQAPEVSLPEVEKQMGFPRDYLDFTMWYLQKKGYITRADNSDFTLTADGVDFVENQRVNIPVLNKMLTSGTTVTSSSSEHHEDLELDTHTSEPVEVTEEVAAAASTNGPRVIIFLP